MTKPTIAEVANIIARHEVDALGPAARHALAADIVDLFSLDGDEYGDLAMARAELRSAREQFAMEAKILEDTVALKSFPKSRREITENQIKRFRNIAADRDGEGVL